MADPLISVIIPVYNGEDFLPETLDSVFAQTYTNIEVIAVDDGSTDNSAEIIKRYPAARYIPQKNGGVGKARNTGMKFSCGDYISFLDQDDLWLPDKLKIQMEIASRNQESGIFFCDGVAFSGDSMISSHLLDQDILNELADAQNMQVTKNFFYKRLLKNNPIACNSQELIPRATMADVGPLNEKRTYYSAAYDYYLRIAAKYPFTFHSDSLVRYRYHRASQSRMMEFRQCRHIFMKINVLKAHFEKKQYPRGFRCKVQNGYRRFIKKAARQAIMLAAPQNVRYARAYLYRLLRLSPTNCSVLFFFTISRLPRRLLMLIARFLTISKNIIKFCIHGKFI
jgi:glycosyltransferase involved in cell wall biosynthesis